MIFMVGRGNGKTLMAMTNFIANRARACPICRMKPEMNWDPVNREIRLRCRKKCFGVVKFRSRVFEYDPVELLCKAVDFWNDQVDEYTKNGEISREVRFSLKQNGGC